MKLLVINGPNLNLLGVREPSVYGSQSYDGLVAEIKEFARSEGCAIEVEQYNGEGEIISAIHGAMADTDGLIINPGAYTHYSHAIHDAIKGAGVKTVEVHLSNIHAREEFRRVSVTAPACAGQISGLGVYGYLAAIRYFTGGGNG